MFRLIAGGFALAVLAFCFNPASAEDKEKFSTWVREADGVELKFEIGQKTAKYHVTAGDNGCIVTSKLKIEKDKVTSEVVDVEVKGNFPGAPKKGEKVTFKWVVKDDTATLSDLEGDNVDGAKGVIEGEYKLKK